MIELLWLFGCIGLPQVGCAIRSWSHPALEALDHLLCALCSEPSGGILELIIRIGLLPHGWRLWASIALFGNEFLGDILGLIGCFGLAPLGHWTILYHPGQWACKPNVLIFVPENVQKTHQGESFKKAESNFDL